MHDKELILEILDQTYRSTQKVLKRFKPIKSVNDFTDSEEGMEKLDAICLQLIAIGEALKNLDKITADSLLSKYPEKKFLLKFVGVASTWLSLAPLATRSCSAFEPHRDC